MKQTVAERRLSADRRRACGGVALAATLGALSGVVATWPRHAFAGNYDAGMPLDVAALVRRVQVSSQRSSFNGTYTVSASGALTSARIVHLCEGHEQFERIETLDGQMRQMFRHNEVVHVLWPRTREAVVQPRELTNDFPTPLIAATKTSLSMYDAQSNGNDRVAGLEAQVVTLKPRDTLRYAQRWWVSQGSDLLLRVDVLNERGEAIESAAFSELQVGSKASSQQLVQQMNRLDGYQVRRPNIVRTTLDREGWVLRTPVPGFDAVSSVRRPVLSGPPHDELATKEASPASPAPADSSPAAATAATAPPVASVLLTSASRAMSAETPNLLQATYSDGLTHISLFIEPYNPTLHRSEAPVVMGATHALAHRVGEWWITAVGDVPTATLKKFATGLERVKP
jgi:sigma-E factor negative regulatory protein RseB